MSTPGSGIDFFVGYAEAEGALAELVPEGALLVLSEEVRAVLDLPEEIGLTEDPETAREDGFVLLATGHPLLMAAARTVLERGDVGCASLPRPTGLPPTPSALEVKARGQIHADHGRIDVTGTPEATDVVVLRVGALLTYSVSIDERVQELEEVWVIADSGRAVPAELSERLRTTHLEPGGGTRAMAPGREGVAGAHELLCARARKRVDHLARETSARLGRQLEVVDDYYERVLSSIDERLGRAAGDRVGMLKEQAEATKREWSRRRSEVADDLTPSFEVKPFRLHLVAVPAYTVEAAVRRGSRMYPLPLRYVPVLASYLPPQCPSCGSEAILVAGKDRLGCRTCMVAAPVPPAPAPAAPAPPPPVPPAPASSITPTPARPLTPTPTRARSTPTRTPPTPTRARSTPTRTPPTPKRSTPKRSGGRVTPKGSVGASSAPKSGVGVAMSFWSSVRSGELRSRDAARNSPMQALLRLYGALGPALVIGLEDAGRMTAITASPVSVEPNGVCSTAGDLQRSGEEDTPFALYWRSGSRSNLLEVEGLPLEYLGPYLTRRDGYGEIFRHRFSHFLTPPPEPLIELDPTAEVLLDQAARFAGLGYAMRCMAAWWYVTGEDDGGGLPIDPIDPIDHPDPSAAAAIESIIAKGLGMKLTIPALAERYGCSADRVRRHLRRFQAVARHATDLRW